MVDEKKLFAAANARGANAAMAKVSDIPFRKEFRAACEANACGRYGKSYTCPPDVGPIDELIERAKGYENAFVFQTIGELEDSFDIEGMEEAGKVHKSVTLGLRDELAGELGDFIALGAGSCQVCGECTKPTGEPCRFPDKAMASLEAYGIAVSELAASCGLKYINGSNTVTYFGAFLYGGKGNNE